MSHVIENDLFGDSYNKHIKFSMRVNLYDRVIYRIDYYGSYFDGVVILINIKGCQIKHIGDQKTKFVKWCNILKIIKDE